MSMKPNVHLVLYVVLAFLVTTPAWSSDASAPKPKLTGMFSDMRFSGEGGDVLGQEIFIVYSKHGYFVVLQSSEGEPGKPVIVPATLKGASVSFRVPADVDSRGEFHGVISQEGLVGTYSGNGQSVNLTRKNSYWQ